MIQRVVLIRAGSNEIDEQSQGIKYFPIVSCDSRDSKTQCSEGGG